MRRVVKLRKDASEMVQYDYSEYPIAIQRNMLSFFPNYAAECHWHDDIEWIVILSGYMMYNVNGIHIRLEAGEGIMVNSKQLHYGFSEAQEECEFICVLIHPLMLCVLQCIESGFVNPIVRDASLPFLHLHPEVPWEGEIISCVKAMVECNGKRSEPLLIQSYFYRIWSLVYENTYQEHEQLKKGDRHLSILKDMLSHIQNHYQDKVTLEDISRAGGVCKSSCTSIFKKYLQSTPVIYLMHYRLNKSTELLGNSDKSITDIAYEVGFSGLSYYTESFHKYYEMSPTEYRSMLSLQDSTIVRIK